MKKPSNKTIAIYLMWGLAHLLLFVSSPPTRHLFLDGGEANLYYPTEFFYPFTKGILNYGKLWEIQFSYFDLQFYDITEFLFYTIAPILIYYAISFWNKPKE